MQHQNSINAYYENIAEGLDLIIRKQVIQFMSHFKEPFARFQLVDLMGIKESTLCGILKQLEDANILADVGSIKSKYNRPNKLYQWNEGIKKESPQQRLF
jgi:hypothetical protein